MKRYFDSSALLCLYFDEEHGEKMHGIMKEPGTNMTSQLALVEVCSALRRGLRAKRISKREHTDLSAQAASHLKHFRLISLSEDVVRAARQAADATGLKSLDALHLASAKISAADLVVTLDQEMARSANDFGMKAAG